MADQQKWAELSPDQILERQREGTRSVIKWIYDTADGSRRSGKVAEEDVEILEEAANFFAPEGLAYAMLEEIARSGVAETGILDLLPRALGYALKVGDVASISETTERYAATLRAAKARLKRSRANPDHPIRLAILAIEDDGTALTDSWAFAESIKDEVRHRTPTVKKGHSAQSIQAHISIILEERGQH